MRTSLVVLVLTLAVAGTPLRALACECSTEALYHSNPKNGAASVSLDIAPVLEGQFDASSVTFEDAHGGAVEFTLQHQKNMGCLGEWAELSPKHALAPHTLYTVHVRALYPSTKPTVALTFTTGDASLPDGPIDPPQLAHASVVRGALDCGGVPSIMACVGGLHDAMPNDLELIARRGDEVLLRITSFIQDDAPFVVPEAPTCIELRRRAADGRRSEAVTVCDEALRVRDVRDSDSERGVIVCHDGRFGTPEADNDAGAVTPRDIDADAGEDAPPPSAARAAASGCAIASGRVGAGDTAAALLCALTWLLGRRRRR